MLRLQSTLTTFYNWSLANFLSLNPCKINHIIFSKRPFIGPLRLLLIGDEFLQYVACTKFLGIFIDSHLNFKENINHIRTRLSRLVGLSYAIGPTMNISAAKSFYYALVYSLLTYGVIFWGASFSCDINMLQVCQNKIVRNLFHNKLNLFLQLELLKVKDIHFIETCTAVYSSIRINKFRPLKHILATLQWQHQYNTRGESTFMLPTVKSTRDKHSYVYQCTLNWNSLPNDIRSASSLYVFKRRLRLLLLNNYVNT